MGEFSGDKDINGVTKTNQNKSLLMRLLQYTNLKYLNRIYEIGIPTYEILGQKKSIIDVALTNSIKHVKTFQVKRDIFGASAQTAHKIIQVTILANFGQQHNSKRKIKKFRYCTHEALLRIKGEVAKKCRMSRLITGDRHPNYKYETIRRMYENVKIKYISNSKQALT